MNSEANDSVETDADILTFDIPDDALLLVRGTKQLIEVAAPHPSSAASPPIAALAHSHNKRRDAAEL